MVNTSNAGPGALAVTIDGPSKVKMDCVECPEGYRVTYTPMAPGNYLISIKYGGPYHIVGSPFKAKITGEEGLCFSGKQNVRIITLEKRRMKKLNVNCSEINLHSLSLSLSLSSRFQACVQPQYARNLVRHG